MTPSAIGSIDRSTAGGPADDPAAVVDRLGRAHGIPGLRVVDASILTDAPSAAAGLTVIMAAELIAAAGFGNAAPRDRAGHGPARPRWGEVEGP